MFVRWVDPHIRSSVAVGVLILCIAGLVLAKRRPLEADGPVAAELASWNLPSGTLAFGGGDPRTAVKFDGTGAEGRFALSHGSLLASGRRELFAQLNVAATDTDSERSPVSFVLVLDTSGSMSGNKLDDARDAIFSMLDQMRHEDRVAVVRFASEASVVVPLSRVGDGTSSIRRKLDAMHAGGNTNIAEALRTAASLLSSTDESNQRIVLVSDGRDTSGTPRYGGPSVARREADRGATVSALGIGTDYDDAYLADVSSAGRGNYEFMRDTSALSRFVSKELHETARTTARRVVAKIHVPRNVRVRSVSGANWEMQGDRVVLTLGSLFAGDERQVVVSLEVDAQEAGSSLAFDTRLSWEPVGDSPVNVSLPTVRVAVVSDPVEVERSRDHSVLANAASVSASQLELEAARAFERGDHQRALMLNRQGRAKVATAAKAAPKAVAKRLRAQEKAYARDAETYKSKKPAPAAARSIGARELLNADRAYGY